MDAESKASLDKSVKDMQLLILAERTQALGQTESGKERMLAYIVSIESVNRHFRTDYLSTDMYSMKITDADGMVQNFMPYLPFHKGQENIFSGK